MTMLYILSALIVLMLAYMRFEAGFLKVERVEFTKSKSGLKILHLSDIHINRLMVPLKRIKNAIDREKPDLVIITGDYIEKPGHIPYFLSFLEYIKGSFPIYLCLGNHDYKAFKRKNGREAGGFIRAIQKKGAIILHNDSVCFEKKQKKYNIIGIDDLKEGSADIDKALSSCCTGAHANIAFSHNPDLVLEFPKRTVDYFFCGHFHGGQIWMPFNLEFEILRKDKLCKQGVRWGLHRINGINLYVNRGLGNVVFPLRFMSRPEITVYYLP